MGAFKRAARFAALFLSTLSLCAFSQAALAQATINSIKAEPAETALQAGKAAVKFTIDGDSPANSNCGLIVQYSGADTQDNRRLNGKDIKFPLVIDHVFTHPGTFNVVAKGDKVNNAYRCFGEANVKVVINDAPAAKVAPAKDAAKSDASKPAAKAPAAAVAAAPKASCPTGWTLSQTSAEKKSGAYTCRPKKKDQAPPEKRAECPAGLTYYEKGATFGCGK